MAAPNRNLPNTLCFMSEPDTTDFCHGSIDPCSLFFRDPKCQVGLAGDEAVGWKSAGVNVGWSPVSSDVSKMLWVGYQFTPFPSGN